jgi:hypothetical protein
MAFVSGLEMATDVSCAIICEVRSGSFVDRERRHPTVGRQAEPRVAPADDHLSGDAHPVTNGRPSGKRRNDDDCGTIPARMGKMMPFERPSCKGSHVIAPARASPTVTLSSPTATRHERRPGRARAEPELFPPTVLAMRLRSARRSSYNRMFVTMPLIALADRAGHPHSTVTDSNHPHWFGARWSVGRWVNHRRRR